MHITCTGVKKKEKNSDNLGKQSHFKQDCNYHGSRDIVWLQTDGRTVGCFYHLGTEP